MTDLAQRKVILELVDQAVADGANRYRACEVIGLWGTRQRSGASPPNLSPPGAGRRDAFREAKRANGIPTSKQPDRVGPNKGERGERQPGRSYSFDQDDRQKVTIRDDAAGHNYGPGNSQNRGSHFNDKFGNHYDY